MKNVFFLLLLCILFLECNFRGTSQKWGIDTFKYSAYYWHHTEDTTVFYLAQLLNIDSDGNYSLMKQDSFAGIPQYFEGKIDDSIHNFIDTAILNKPFQSAYFFKSGSAVFYDGFTYCIDYATAAKRTTIQFIPSESPQSIKNLSVLFDTLIYARVGKKIPAFNTILYKNELENIVRRYGQEIVPPAKQPKVTIIKKK